MENAAVMHIPAAELASGKGCTGLYANVYAALSFQEHNEVWKKPGRKQWAAVNRLLLCFDTENTQNIIPTLKM